MKILTFSFRGEVYKVDEKGRINANNIGHYSDTWIFLGGSRHHWNTHIDISLKAAFKNPSLLDGCIGWDLDHGTTRQWGGHYYGKLPRIRFPHVGNVDLELTYPREEA